MVFNPLSPNGLLFMKSCIPSVRLFNLLSLEGKLFVTETIELNAEVCFF